VASVLERSGTTPVPYALRVRYPQLSGLSPAIGSAVNAALRAAATRLAGRFVVELSSAPPSAQGGQESELAVDFTTTLLDRSVASFLLSGTDEVAGAAQPSFVAEGLSFDLRTGEQLGLASLFRPGTDYLAVLSNAAVAALDARFGPGDWASFAGPTAADFSVFALTPTGIEVEFLDAPQALAAPVVTIPASALASVAEPGGPLS
jgi:hypothetical protein